MFCCGWSVVSCAQVHIGNVGLRFLDDLWQFSFVQLLISESHIRQGKLLKAVGLRTIQAFLSVLLPPLEYVFTVINLFSHFQKAQPVLNFTQCLTRSLYLLLDTPGCFPEQGWIKASAWVFAKWNFAKEIFLRWWRVHMYPGLLEGDGHEAGLQSWMKC